MKAKYIFLAASALLLGSCSDIEEFVGGSTSQNEITFGDSFVGKAHTRAATGDLNSETLKNFPVKVWGEKYSGTTYDKDNATTVFDGTKLTCNTEDDTWKYEGEAKKWEDFNYDFVGFAPYESMATVSYTEGKATVSGVPLVQTIKNESGALSGEDYLLSKVSTSKYGNKREAVSLGFDHILSRLTLKAYTSLDEHYKVTLKSLQLFTPTTAVGTASATYKEANHEGPDKDTDTWSWEGFTNNDNATSSAELMTTGENGSYAEHQVSTGDIALSKGEASATKLSQEFFVAPTKGQTVTFYVQVAYTVAFADGSDSKDYTKFVKVDALKDGLVQGYQHNLFIDINPKAIKFSVYKVEGWNLDNYGNDFVNEKGHSFGFNLDYDQTNAVVTGILHAKGNYLTNGDDKYLEYSVASIAKDGDASKVSTSGNKMTIDGWYSSVANATAQNADNKEDKASVGHAYAHFTIEPDYDFLSENGTGDYIVSIKNNMNDVNTGKIDIPTVKLHWFTMTATPENFHINVVAKCGGNEAQSFTANNASFGLNGANGTVASVSAIKWYDNAEGSGTSTTAWSKTNRYAHFQVTPDASNFTQSGGNYTLKLTNDFNESQSQNVSFSFAEMKFTIKTTSSSKTFAVPLKTGATPATMAIVWGDNQISANDLNSISSANSKHTYSAAQNYQIRILSAQTDVTKEQIPEFNFGKYPTNTESSFSDNPNAYLLTGFDTALLRMYASNDSEKSLRGLFYGCNNLATVSATLFDNHTDVMSLMNLFSTDNYSNNAMKSVPKGLFDKCSEVKIMKQIFYGCGALEDIPDGLFANNIHAIAFTGLFYGCSKLKMNPNMFINEKYTKETRFLEASKATTIDFGNIFCNAGKNRTDNYGTVPALWDYTYGIKGYGWKVNNNKYRTPFSSTTIKAWTNKTSIPDYWGRTSSFSKPSNTNYGWHLIQ